MICTSFLPKPDGGLIGCEFKSEIERAIDRIRKKHPKVASDMEEIIEMSAEIVEIAFAGKGSFNQGGSYCDVEFPGNYRYKIVYYIAPFINFPTVMELAKKFRCYVKIKNKKH